MDCINIESKVNSKHTRDCVANRSSMNPDRSFCDSAEALKQLSNRQNNEQACFDNEIHISRTNLTPEYIFNQEGIIKIKGRGLYCDKPELSGQLICWIEEYLNNPAKITYVTIAFEFLNSVTTAVLVSILRRLSKIIIQPEKLVVQWYYEADDDNILDRGKYVSSSCDIPIEFILTNNITRL